jgi:uncharacterized protein (DUF58 family)
MTAVASRFLDLPSLAALAHMRFSTRQRIEGNYSGRHRSRQQGGAAEFVDYREYAAGEDLRRLDWKVLARTGKAYVRQYQDETNLLCTLAVDASGSMTFNGSHDPNAGGSKLEYAQYLATALAHVIQRGQDQVGLALLTDKLQHALPPGGTQSHVHALQTAIAEIRPTETTCMAPALQSLFQQQRTRGVILLISDFLVDDLEDVFAAARLFKHRQCDVIALHLIHPDEERLPTGPAWQFEGLEGEGRVDCSPGEIRDLYEQGFQRHCELVRGSALAAGCDYRRVSTAVNYLETVGDFLIDRSG